MKESHLKDALPGDGVWTVASPRLPARKGILASRHAQPAQLIGGSGLSARDAAELVRAAVESEGLTFVVANGISANRYRRADLEQTVSSLGYHPVDDAWA